MANELKLIYPKTAATVTAKAFYDNSGTLTARSGTASLTEDVAGIYRGDAADITDLTKGDLVIYYDEGAIIASETYTEASVDGIATTLAGTLGTDGKMLISSDSQDLSTTLHVDAGSLGGDADTTVSLAIAAAFWANTIIVDKDTSALVIRNRADDADLYNVQFDEITDPTKLIRTITAAP